MFKKYEISRKVDKFLVSLQCCSNRVLLVGLFKFKGKLSTAYTVSYVALNCHINKYKTVILISDFELLFYFVLASPELLCRTLIIRKNSMLIIYP